MLRRLKHSVDAVTRRARFEREMRDELRAHIEARARDLIDAGIAPEDAARQARVEFGAVERYKEQCRDARGFAAVRPFHGLGGDLRLGLRRLAATPQFFVFAVLSIAVGIGVTTSAYSVLHSLSKPIHAADPDRTVFLTSTTPARRARVSVADFEDLARAQRGFRYVAASSAFFQTLAAPARSELVLGEAVSGEYFSTLGLRLAMGRGIQQHDDARGLAVVVLSHRLWRKRFGSDPAIVGTAVRLGGHAFEVVGVAAPDVQGLNQGAFGSSVWVPLDAAARFEKTPGALADRRQRASANVIGLLRPNVSTAAAAAEMRAIGTRLDAESPLTLGGAATARAWSADPIETRTDGLEALPGNLLFFGMIGLVLVVACLNLANLMLARGSMRQREFAVRRALGASRWRLVREICVESGVIAIAGGGLGLVLLRALLEFATVDIPLFGAEISIEPQVDGASLAVAAGALLLSIVVFGIEPAWQLTRGSVRGDLSGGDAAIGAPRTGRQRGFIRWQVAISSTFLLVAAILARVVVAELRHDPGLDLDRLAVATVPFARTWDRARAERVLSEAIDRLRLERAIESVAVSSSLPFGVTGTPFVHVTGHDRPVAPDTSGAFLLSSSPEIFQTLGVRIVRGRRFTDRDDAAAAPVIVISERTARDAFGTVDPIGQRIVLRKWGRPPDLPFTVIGVSSDTDAQSLMSRKSGIVYVPRAQHFEPGMATIVARTAEPAMGARLIQNALRQVEPDLAAANAGAASVVLAGARALARAGVILAATLGALTLVLAMIGLYGVQSHLVAQRTREIGVRMALGAAAAQIRGLVLRQGFRPVLEGLVLGLAFGALVRALIRAYIDARVTPVDPIAFALVPIPLILAALVACYAPARRASRVDPNEALRHL